MCFSLAASHLKTLTKKPTVRWSLEEGVVAKDFSEITVGLQLVGWIKNIMSYGVFVEFPYGLVGLAPKSVSKELLICKLKGSYLYNSYIFSWLNFLIILNSAFPGHD